MTSRLGLPSKSMVLEESPGETPLAVLHTHARSPCRPTPAGVCFSCIGPFG